MVQKSLEKKKKSDKNNNRLLKNNAKYLNIAFQMIAIMLLCVFGGIKLDSVISWNFPVFTLLLTISGVIIAIFYVIKDLLK